MKYLNKKALPFICIIGDERSGSTFLARLLAEKMGLLILPESNFIQQVLQKIPIFEQLSNESKNQLNTIIKKDIKLQDWQLAPEVLDIIVNTSRSTKECIDKILNSYCQQKRQTHTGLCLKKSNYGEHYSQLLMLFPNLLFIGLIRDGRAVCNSKKKTIYWKTLKPLESSTLKAAETWCKQYELLQEIQKLHPEKILTIYYEKLVTTPTQVLRKITAFCKIKKTKTAMLYELPERYKAIHKNIFSPPLPQRIRAWRYELELQEIKEFERIAGSTLKKSGYRLLFDKPSNNNCSKALPIKVRLEASSICQLRCPLCHQTTTHPHNPNLSRELLLPRGFLSLRNFRLFIEKHPYIKEIELSNNGEVFLNPELIAILKYAHARDIIITLENGVNFNTVTVKQLRALVKYQVKTITISIDGPTQEIYQLYRINGQLKKVLQNIKKLQQLKKRSNSEQPRLIWQTIGFGHNEELFDNMEKMATELGVEYRIKFNHTPTYSPLKNKDIIAQKIGYATYQDYLQKRTYSPCQMTFQSPQIDWNGTLLGCCINYWYGFGNVFTDGLEKCMQNKEYQDMLKVAKKTAEPETSSACAQCNILAK